MTSETTQAAAVYATVNEGRKALVEINGRVLQIVVIRSGSLASRMVSILLYA